MYPQCQVGTLGMAPEVLMAEARGAISRPSRTSTEINLDEWHTAMVPEHDHPKPPGICDHSNIRLCGSPHDGPDWVWWERAVAFQWTGSLYYNGPPHAHP